jgi:hypothetical protein
MGLRWLRVLARTINSVRLHGTLTREKRGAVPTGPMRPQPY